MVNDSVLKALGPQGFLINAARGSVVDTKALTKALCDGTIAGAALDVFETEPYVPADLLAAPNLIVTPHLAGRAPEAIQAFMKLVRANLDAHFSGQPLITPILQGGTTR
jgi:phosphoglycerate dehydrogenase-like enzyme